MLWGGRERCPVGRKKATCSTKYVANAYERAGVGEEGVEGVRMLAHLRRQRVDPEIRHHQYCQSPGRLERSVEDLANSVPPERLFSPVQCRGTENRCAATGKEAALSLPLISTNRFSFSMGGWVGGWVVKRKKHRNTLGPGKNIDKGKGSEVSVRHALAMQRSPKTVQRKTISLGRADDLKHKHDTQCMSSSADIYWFRFTK